MSPEAQRIAIAEAVGFDLWVIVKRGAYYRENANGYTHSLAEAWKLPLAAAKKYEMYSDRDDVPGCEKVLLERAPLPDYLNDLNAMHEAEDTVMTGDPFDGDSLRYRYTSLLYRIVPAERQPCRATAAQRAEAFLRVLGKWTEGEA